MLYSKGAQPLLEELQKLQQEQKETLDKVLAYMRSGGKDAGAIADTLEAFNQRHDEIMRKLEPFRLDKK
ncbi:MAG TPA: hypothetical protein VGH81_03655 [Rudaea sp.]|jgi:hypothetical protein